LAGFLEVARALGPDVLIVTRCGFSLARTECEMHFLAAQPGFDQLRAVSKGRVFVADGNLYFNRASPSLFRKRQKSSQKCCIRRSSSRAASAQPGDATLDSPWNVAEPALSCG